MHGNTFKQVSTYWNWLVVTYNAIANVNSSMPSLRIISIEKDKKKLEN